MSQPNFKKVIDFVIELDKLKLVERRIKNLNSDRFENSAEHSWQVAILAMGLAEELRPDLDVMRIVKMLLIHDIVEIDTGDVFAYDPGHDNFANELKAAERLFALLPSSLSEAWLALWLEFERMESEEAVFAKGMDRIMPVLLNINNNGQSWRDHGITVEQVLQKNAVAKKASPELWDYISQQVEQVLA